MEQGVEHYGTGWYTRLLGTGWLPLAAYQHLEARCPIHHKYNPDPTKLFHNYPLHPSSKTKPTVDPLSLFQACHLPVQSLFKGRRVDLLSYLLLIFLLLPKYKGSHVLCLYGKIFDSHSVINWSLSLVD